MQEQNEDAGSEVDLFKVMEERVRAGQPVYIGGSLAGAHGMKQLQLIERLRAVTGRAVHAIFH